MTLLEAMQTRHSVRSYKNIPLKPEDILTLQKEIDACNEEDGLHIQLVTNEPKAFDSFMAHYGKSKPMETLCPAAGAMPEWFRRGMEAAMLAPTAMNQQKFTISLSGNTVTAKSSGGFYSKTDLGIVKYHFEIGAGKECFTWAK